MTTEYDKLDYIEDFSYFCSVTLRSKALYSNINHLTTSYIRIN